MLPLIHRGYGFGQAAIILDAGDIAGAGYQYSPTKRPGSGGAVPAIWIFLLRDRNDCGGNTSGKPVIIRSSRQSEP
jgi:hypothetical protein